jgi:hypothetical protein
MLYFFNVSKLKKTTKKTVTITENQNEGNSCFIGHYDMPLFEMLFCAKV